jgi:hypothetical protein
MSRAAATGPGPTGSPPLETKTPSLGHRLSHALWRAAGRRRSRSRSPDPAIEPASELFETRIAHLEAALEGLQDAVYRLAVLEDRHFRELQRRTEPEQIARDLSYDARRRGL